MNFRIDFILQSEQRSASILSPKMILRITCVTIPLVLLTLGGLAGTKMWRTNSELASLEQQWAIDQPKQDAAIALQGLVAQNKEMYAATLAWKKIHLDICKVLSEVIKETQANVQYETLRLGESLQADGTRIYNIVIKGRSYGNEAETSVLSLRKKLSVNPYLDPLLVKVEVPVFKSDDTPGADPSVRIFQIDCLFEPRKFE
jgi:hypothetical protein